MTEDSDYVKKIEKAMEELSGDDLGIAVQFIVSEENLSWGEIIAVEEELNKLGTSMYEKDT